MIVSYDEWSGENTHIEAAVKRAVEELNKEEERWRVLWARCGALLGKMARIASVRIKLQISDNSHNFMCCDFLTTDSRLCNGAAVAVGAIFSDGSSYCYDRAWQRCVAAAIEENEVRYIAGVFLPPSQSGGR